ncbi:MAG: small multi-drug export protein [Clostridia bacterium]|nr:small multi-drug export protein [Clostridia bacterium]
MKEAIANFFLETVGEELCVFFCSMLPIIELRGAIPLGAGFGLPWWQTYLIAIVGNMLPVPIILLFVKSVLTWMVNCKVKFFNKIANKMFEKAEKNRDKIEKYAFWGLTLFVAIPLPATGAWTGTLVAALFDMKFWKSILSALLGVMIAGVVMTLISYGVVAAFGAIF